MKLKEIIEAVNYLASQKEVIWNKPGIYPEIEHFYSGYKEKFLEDYSKLTDKQKSKLRERCYRQLNFLGTLVEEDGLEYLNFEF